MSGAALAYAGLGVLIVGVEDDEDGRTRVYIGARYQHRYFLLAGDAAERVRREWNTSSHLLIHRDEVPPLMGERSVPT